MIEPFVVTVEEVYRKTAEQLETEIRAAGYEPTGFRPLNVEEYYWVPGSGKPCQVLSPSKTPFIVIQRLKRKRYVLEPVREPTPGEWYSRISTVRDRPAMKSMYPSIWIASDNWTPYSSREEEY